MVQSALGRAPRIHNPSSIHTFPDHLSLAGNLPGITAEALAGIQDLRAGQRRIAQELGIQFHATASGGSTGICHTVVREEIALPGQVILGNGFAYLLGRSAELPGIRHRQHRNRLRVGTQ